MVMCFIGQSWGDHTDVAQAVVAYALLMLAVFVYSWFGEELTQQVRIICIFQTDNSERFLRVHYYWSIPVSWTNSNNEHATNNIYTSMISHLISETFSSIST
jgi:hypothetical protein